jgi:tripartite-type tricarboxylate transporter receptor subunit TctC
VRVVGLLAGSVIAATIGSVSLAHAQAWPTHPIQWIVPFDPGGSTDIVARIVAEKLSQRLGQQVVIINRAGANSEVGYKDTANAKPDGYTMVLTVPSVVTNTFYFKDSLDPKQLTPVIYLADGPYVLLASNKLGAKSIDDVIKKIKDNPGSVSCGLTGGVGSIGCEMLEAKTKTKLLKIPYKGSAPGNLAVMQGEIDLVFNFSITSQTVVASNRASAIGTTAPKRGSQPFPDLPTLNEALPGFELAGWDGVMVPNGTPPDIVKRLNAEINAVLQLPDVQKTLTDGGLQTVGGTPEDFAKRIDDAQKTFGSVLTETGVKPE